MKLITRTLSLLTLASLVLFLANCGGGSDGKSNKEKKQLQKLSDTWTLTAVDLDGTDRLDDFTGFKLTVGGTYNSENPEGPYSYSTTGSTPEPGPWPTSGTWSFSSINSSEVLIIRDPDSDDAIGMSYKFLSNGNLVMTLNVPDGSEGWRTAEVSGTWTFTFTK